MAFLNEVWERLRLLQEWFGYLLTPDTSPQSFLILVRDGANGESVVLTVLASILGQQNVSSVPQETFGERFQLTATLGTLAHIVTELESRKHLAEGFVKQCVGGDAMHFDRKNRESVTRRPTARVVVSTNNLPRIGDTLLQLGSRWPAAFES